MSRISILALLVPIVLTACASHGAENPSRDGEMTRGGHATGERHNRASSGDAFTRAVSLVDQGHYAQALPILRCIAGQGRGYEIAQYLAL